MDSAELDRRHCWHPFTPNDLWLDPERESIVIERGSGAWLYDSEGRSYLDGNSSIWTNLHGHAHPGINAAIQAQMGRIAHSSFLGLTQVPAPTLASRLAALTGGELPRVFFSDDGSTAIEAALKINHQYFQQNGQPQRTRYITLESSYHGDTVGAMSLGKVPAFHSSYGSLLFATDKAMLPACYRCPFNKARAEKTDARLCRKCNWECAKDLESKIHSNPETAAALVMEPLVQGVAGFAFHPEGYLEKAARLIRAAGGHLILDEVMTGFYRTGRMFAHQHEGVVPDMLALAKGITGGYLPLAATMVTEKIFTGFSGSFDRTFYHGHSYTANQLGCAAALASLDLLEEKGFTETYAEKSAALAGLGKSFWNHPNVGDVRHQGMILAVEIVENFFEKKPFDPKKRTGWHICEEAKKRGLLTRPIGDVLLLMPPYCTTRGELEKMTTALYESIQATLG